MEFTKKLRRTMGLMDGGFEELLESSFFEAAIFFLATLILGCAITSAAILVQGKFDIVAVFLFLMIYGFWWAMVFPILSHIVLMLVGWKHPIQNTFKSYFYGATPTLLFGWIPCIGALASLVAVGNVIRLLQSMDAKNGWKASVAVVVPFISFVALVLFFYMVVKMYGG